MLRLLPAFFEHFLLVEFGCHYQCWQCSWWPRMTRLQMMCCVSSVTLNTPCLLTHLDIPSVKLRHVYLRCHTPLVVISVNFMFNISTPKHLDLLSQSLRQLHLVPAVLCWTLRFSQHIHSSNTFWQNFFGLVLTLTCSVVVPPCYVDDWCEISMSWVYWQPQGSEHCMKSVHTCCSSSGRSWGSTYISDRHSFSHCHSGSCT